MREENAPQRIDGGGAGSGGEQDEAQPILEPRKQLENLKKALMVIGVEEDFYERVWGRMAAKTGGDLKEVVRIMKEGIEKSMADTAGIAVPQKDVNMMD